MMTNTPLMTTPSMPPTVGSFFSADMLGTAKKDPKAVAGLFEAIFYRSILQQMRTDTEDDPLFGSPEMAQIQGMFDDEMANHMGMMGQLGIASQLAPLIENSQGQSLMGGENLPLGLLKPPLMPTQENKS